MALAAILANSRQIALALAAAAIATLVGAWIFEWAGYLPCKLCLQQRLPYYALIPVALVVAWIAGSPARATVTRLGLLLVAVICLVSAGMGAFHAGIEWGWWEGPADCGGRIQEQPKAVGDFLKGLNQAYVIRCTEAAIRIAGLSLAGWNALISLGLAGLAGLAAARVGAASAA